MFIKNMSKLLIVDDEIDIREFTAKFFRKRNIEVFVASGGCQALILIEKERPDLVLLDVRMEGMTGIEVLRELYNRNLFTKVIVISAVFESETISEAMAFNAIAFINKPFILEDLEDMVLYQLNIPTDQK